MHYAGDGVARDYAEAARWNRLVAEEGEALAQDNLGMMYEAGVSQDCSKAVEWYRMAAAGFANALCNLSRCYENGVGVIQDFTEAPTVSSRC